ncbi:distal membrane-arm assembly complex protein 2-like [Panonychus citri]|uniref:distal membrane-arm assembly complex protein 2-like n=1 Tax=Panonychus citri TaxID=50023 RepID=UPI00230826A0|nr:distal membrane-arm assembly complex protein 2-like [Panonychus citri]
MAMKRLISGVNQMIKSSESKASRLVAYEGGQYVPMVKKDIPLPAPIDIPCHPELLTVEHVDRAIEVYQEEFKTITCSYIEIKKSIMAPEDPKDMFDESDKQLRYYSKKRYRLSDLLERARARSKLKDIIAQKFNPKRTGILGPDLAASHFITYRGGRVKFVGSDTWVSTDIVLPKVMDTAFKVERIDASACELRYEGLDNLINLKQLVHLDLSDNPLDDWACGRLACHFRNSTKLKYLNLSDNKDVTAIGLQSLIRIPTLETIVITGTKAANYQHLELLMILIQDLNPKCKIEV